MRMQNKLELAIILGLFVYIFQDRPDYMGMFWIAIYVFYKIGDLIIAELRKLSQSKSSK